MGVGLGIQFENILAMELYDIDHFRAIWGSTKLETVVSLKPLG